MDDERLWTVTYKGYTAGIYFSKEDDIYYGKIDNISDLVNFESADAQTIGEQFQNAVDDYILLCNEINKNLKER